MFRKIIFRWGSLLALLFFPVVAFAHEAYVLNRNDFWHHLSEPFDFQAFNALKNPHDVQVFISITVGIVVVFLINFLFRRMWVGEKFHNLITKLAPTGPFLVRVAIAASFFFSAQSMAFLGPELLLNEMFWPHVLQIGLYLISFMILFGFLTELAAFLGIIFFSIGFYVYGLYMATYLNYLGELIVLLLFGMRSWSFDAIMFGPLKFLKHFEKYEATIVRIFYGLGLAYAAVTVKLLHSDLTTEVVTHWHLTQFHWLFPGDPLLVVLGGGLAELAIGLFIVFGFEMRLTILISLFYITLSLMYFRELVWPHLLLYGISLNLLVQPEVFTLDHIFFEEHRAKKRWWLRPFSPHRHQGKSLDREQRIAKKIRSLVSKL